MRTIRRLRRLTQKARARRLAKASRRVRKESMQVNAEFAAIEGEPEVHHWQPRSLATVFTH